MTALFYLAAAIAIVATAAVVTRRNAAHAALYLIVSLLAVALIFFLLGAPFVAALEIIIYAGAIMVLFVFFIMTLNLGARAAEQESAWLRPRTWIGPAILALLLALEFGYLLWRAPGAVFAAEGVGPPQVSLALFGPYLLGVELASFLLLAGLVGAYHLGSQMRKPRGEAGAESRWPAGADASAGEGPQRSGGADRLADAQPQPPVGIDPPGPCRQGEVER